MKIPVTTTLNIAIHVREVTIRRGCAYYRHDGENTCLGRLRKNGRSNKREVVKRLQLARAKRDALL